MNLLLILLVALSNLFAFGTITSQNASGGGYQTLPEAVRDFYSKEVFFQAQPKCKFLQFAKVKKDLTAVRGKTITFTRYNNLTGGGAIAENATFVPVGMSADDVLITVSEQMNGVELTELLIKTSMLDVVGDSTKQLANNLAQVLDGQLATAALATTNIVYGNGAASSSAMIASDVFNTKTVKDAVEVLSINNAPKFFTPNGDAFYVCIAHPTALRQLRDDPNWINANSYMGRRQLYIGEAGMYEGVIFIDTTNMPKLASASVVTKYGGTFAPNFGCESVIFGENAYAWAVALDPELRDDGVKEMGRKHQIGWYGIWGTGLIEEDNIVRILSAATV